MNNNTSIPFSEIKVVIFDMDNLMIDSHPVHTAVFEELLNRFEISQDDPKYLLTKDEELAFFGMKIIDICAFLIKKYKLVGTITAEEMNNEFNRILLKTYEKKIEAMPGLMELVQTLSTKKYKLAVASSAKKIKIDTVLRKFKLTNVFDAIVSGEDEHMPGKPAPDMFLKAAEKLGVDVKICLVLEDAKNGVEAAKAAGMYCIGVHNMHDFKRLEIRQDLHVADKEVDGLEQVQALLSSFDG